MEDTSPEIPEYILKDELTNAILMHRDAHFGGKFEFMIEYYKNEGKGTLPEFTLEKIRELRKIEEATEENLAAILLSGPEAERVGEALETYKKLREVYEKNDSESSLTKLIADLVLSEEEEPREEIDAIVKKKNAIVPALIHVIRSENLYDPLFPGYGLAPALAMKCLGLIGDERSIISLFECIGRSEVLDEELAIEALRYIGEPAKKFLLKVASSHPVTEDNERATIALISFKDNQEIAHTCLQLLKDPVFRKTIPLSAYLALACEGLSDEKDREEFRKLAMDPITPNAILPDFKTVIKSWK